MFFYFVLYSACTIFAEESQKPRTMEQQKPKRLPYGMQNWEDVRLHRLILVWRGMDLAVAEEI